jgi:hypothetical protein
MTAVPQATERLSSRNGAPGREQRDKKTNYGELSASTPLAEMTSRVEIASQRPEARIGKFPTVPHSNQTRIGHQHSKASVRSTQATRPRIKAFREETPTALP